MKNELVDEGIEIGILNDQDRNNISLTELICWMSMGKITKVTKSIFDYNNKSIARLDNILTHYTHFKMKEISTDMNVKQGFEFFMRNGLDEFFHSLPRESRLSYKKGIDSLCYCFGIIL
mmetsp:Transcript_17359/g.19446  ORF Transcript_17359/g.19446 Transcript_17359/m.19446 type:complete len:119 (-) Transcript_17359:38-394(-)